MVFARISKHSVSTRLQHSTYMKLREILSIPHVITKSSEGVLGWAPHSPSRAPLPEYPPVDESHPCRPQDAYGLSKLVSEQVAQSFALRCGIEAIALRPPRIVGPSELIELHERRGLRPTKFSLLHYVDVRDLARACEAAVTIQHSGFVALFVGSGESLVDEPLSATFARLAPELAVKASCVPSSSGAISIEKAQSTLGWSPMFSWRMSPGEMQVRSKQTEGV
jgi:nucleoside-diphosphate-sugar epimerase